MIWPVEICEVRNHYFVNFMKILFLPKNSFIIIECMHTHTHTPSLYKHSLIIIQKLIITIIKISKLSLFRHLTIKRTNVHVQCTCTCTCTPYIHECTQIHVVYSPSIGFHALQQHACDVHVFNMHMYPLCTCTCTTLW